MWTVAGAVFGQTGPKEHNAEAGVEQNSLKVMDSNNVKEGSEESEENGSRDTGLFGRKLDSTS